MIMTTAFKTPQRLRQLASLLAALALIVTAPAFAQVQSMDPNAAIDGDLATPRAALPAPVQSPAAAVPAAPTIPVETPADPSAASAPTGPGVAVGSGETYKQDDLIGAAEGVFGKGAQGLAGLIENLLRQQGEPNAYIVGREGGGALVLGLRYGSGTLYHKIEGERPVYWTGPSIGFDAGANVGNTFVLVYNLHDTADLYHRFPAGEGQIYIVGGFNASYMRRGDIVLIPIRVGAGLRLGVNAGYMRFSTRHRWFPL